MLLTFCSRLVDCDFAKLQARGQMTLDSGENKAEFLGNLSNR
ncbi:MAG: hypothetical protein V2B20_24685 [Pseudomonadota bacterium]